MYSYYLLISSVLYSLILLPSINGIPTRHCARVWSVLIWFLSDRLWDEDLGAVFEDSSQEHLWGSVGSRAGQLQMSTWPIAQRLEGRESSELSWVEAMRPELHTFTLTSYWVRVNAISCVKFQTRDQLRADSRQQFQQLGKWDPCPERELGGVP